MYKYGVVAIAALLAGCSPKANNDVAWKSDCATFYSQSSIDYMLCMKRKQEAAEAEKAKVAPAKPAAPAEGGAVRTSKIATQKGRNTEKNELTMEELGENSIL